VPDPIAEALATANKLLTSLAEGRFTEAAELIDPLAAQAFRDDQLDNHRHSELLAKGPPPEWGMTFEQAAQFLPKLPNPFLRRIWDVPDVAAFEALSPTTVVARFLAFRFAKAPDGTVGRAPGRVLGTVSEDPDFVHVVLRGSKSWRDRPDWEPVAALTMKRAPGSWRALLNGELVYGSDGGLSIGLSGEDTVSPPDAG
jgi:hypothetical protein